MRNNKGFSFLEVLIAASICVFAYLAVFFVIQMQRTAYSQAEVMNILNNLVMDNLIEIRGQNINTVPAANACRVRLYDFGMTLKTEILSTTSSTDCDTSNVPLGRIKLVWMSYGPDKFKSEITFEPAGVLKLPELNQNSLKQVELTGSVRKEGSAAGIEKIQTVVFVK